MQRTSVLRLMVNMIPSITAKMVRFSMVKPSFTSASGNYRGKHAAFESHVSVPLHGRQRHAVHISWRMDGVGFARKTRFRSACTHWIVALTTDRKRCMGENKMTLCVTVAMVTHMQEENSRWLSFNDKRMHQVLVWTCSEKSRGIAPKSSEACVGWTWTAEP